MQSNIVNPIAMECKYFAKLNLSVQAITHTVNPTISGVFRNNGGGGGGGVFSLLLPLLIVKLFNPTLSTIFCTVNLQTTIRKTDFKSIFDSCKLKRYVIVKPNIQPSFNGFILLRSLKGLFVLLHSFFKHAVKSQ